MDQNRPLGAKEKPVEGRKKNNRRSEQERLQIAIAAVREGNNSLIAKKYNMTEGGVRRCIKAFSNKDEFLSILGKGSFVSKSRKCKYTDLEEQLKMWIRDQREKKLAISMKEICSKALEIFTILYPAHIGEFNASRGWFWRFVKRANLSRRCPTHVIQQFREDVNKEIKEFWKEVWNIRTKVEIF